MAVLNGNGWGWNVHRNISKVAVYKLPEPLIAFYKKHIEYLAKHSINPDKKSFIDSTERFRHFINTDFYIRNNMFDSKLPNWCKLLDSIDKDSVIVNGTLPWTIISYYSLLKEAFKVKDKKKILHYSAYLSHYVSDLTVPLHCREDYDGLNKNQKGIHRLFETILPDFNIKEYNFFSVKTKYIDNVKDVVYTTIYDNYYKADTLFVAYDSITRKYNEIELYYPDKYKNRVQNRFNNKALNDFYLMSNKMTERQILKAIWLTSSLWYSAWIEAGQPQLK
ncbi:MAG: hypothetical protein A2X12_02265 [Bacteroidetes bacterium GWE2_29_8]|nr:MAG: hypothetical protein A2X12_02265 [Bacteroidetes bacterium GWE2_29_8]OFY19169.1 MAG: hypothetical protein A2X02_01625 [Bacteroidetes bacterium GWF2_29_10]